MHRPNARRPETPPRRLARLSLLATLWLAACDSQHNAAPAATPAPAAATAPGSDYTAAATRDAPEGFSPPDAQGYGRAAGLVYLEAVVGQPPPGARLPMVVFIHGLGGRAHHGWLRAQSDIPLRLIMPQAPMPRNDGFGWFPYRARDNDQAALADGIERAAAQLARALQQLTTHRPTVGKPVISGFSQGGMLTYALYTTIPDRIAGALPMSGMLPPALWPTAGPPDAGVSYPPLHAFHGTADPLVPYPPTRDLVAKLVTLGYPASLTSIERLDHSTGPMLGPIGAEAVALARAQLPVEQQPATPQPKAPQPKALPATAAQPGL